MKELLFLSHLTTSFDKWLVNFSPIMSFFQEDAAYNGTPRWRTGGVTWDIKNKIILYRYSKHLKRPLLSMFCFLIDHQFDKNLSWKQKPWIVIHRSYCLNIRYFMLMESDIKCKMLKAFNRNLVSETLWNLSLQINAFIKEKQLLQDQSKMQSLKWKVKNVLRKFCSSRILLNITLRS